MSTPVEERGAAAADAMTHGAGGADRDVIVTSYGSQVLLWTLAVLVVIAALVLWWPTRP